jgi:hypothetical protein
MPNVFTITNGSAFGNVAGSEGLLPENTPYVVLGGGIGGVRAAVSRLIPGTSIFASWASSAPVQAQIDFPQYFEAIDNAIPGKNCSDDLQAIRAFADQILNGTSQDFTPELFKEAIIEASIGEFNASINSTVTQDDVVQTSTLDLMRTFINSLSFFQV